MWPFKICFGLPDQTIVLTAWEIQAKSAASTLKRKKGEKDPSYLLIEDLSTFLIPDTSPLLDKKGNLVFSHVVDSIIQRIEDDEVLMAETTVITLLNEIKTKCTKKRTQKEGSEEHLI